MFIVYVLKCSFGKYYVGRTMDLSVRINQHKNRGILCPMWTKIYPIMEILWRKKTNNEDLEMLKTLEYTVCILMVLIM